MQLYVNDNTKIKEKVAIALGNFDGLHIGHQKLINIMKQKSEELGLESMVFTFLTNTKTVLDKDNNIELLMDNTQKEKELKKMGIDYLCMIDFSQDIMKLSPEEFIKKILIDRFNVKLITIGFNYRFGYKGQGDVDTLKEIAKKYGIEVIVVSPVKCKSGQIISSTYIRKLIKDGNISTANILLGRNFTLRGKVLKGKTLGKKLGFPTANIKINKSIIPKLGVYKTRVLYNSKEYNGITNIGLTPTFDGKELVVETHLLGFNEDIYGKDISVELIDFIRPEKKFKSKEELITQIRKDISNLSNIIH
ncbi:bifunctional riboflavin kinase/FAD synthetase [Clostridiaceae bacterium M8S5]|nr:bifunctional riboflavin kinase/FAD synthetase [Clostridiaceae bacterium M8S5]